MPFAFTWDATFTSLPQDNEAASLGASRIRDLKNAITEREQVDHSWTGTASDGAHIKVTLLQQGADPSAATTTGFLYTKNVAGATELFYRDAAGNIVPITNAGFLNGTFVSGTRMSFNQTAAPIGWTKDTTAGLNDTALRIVTGAITPNGTGGSVAFSTALASPVVTGSTAGYVLQIADIPAHTHSVPQGGGTQTLTPGGTTAAFTNPQTTGSTGGGGAHSHGAGTLVTGINVKYTDFIIASKN